MHENPYEAPRADLSALSHAGALSQVSIDAAVVDALNELAPWLRRLQIVCWSVVGVASSIALASSAAILLDELSWGEKAQDLLFTYVPTAALATFPARSLGRVRARLVELEESRNLAALTDTFDALRSVWKVAALALWLWLGTHLVLRIVLVIDAVAQR